MNAGTQTLTNQQIRHFHEEGYLIVENVFDPHDLEPLRRELAEQIDAKLNALFRGCNVRELHPHEPFERRLTRIYRDNPANGEAVIRALQGKGGGGQRGIEMFNVISHPKLLDVVESLVGPEIIGSSVYRLRPKVPGFGGAVVPWHQDSGYLAGQCDAQLIVTCWIPLVDATEENGCLRILPRAHQQGICTHHTGGNANFLVIEDGDLPRAPAAAITAEVPLGGVVLLTNMTPHSSTPNRTDVIRWSVDLRYQSATVPNNVGLWPTPDRDNQPVEIQMACYPPEADFVVRSEAHPEWVADYGAFLARRLAYEQAPLSYPNRNWQPVGSSTA